MHASTWIPPIGPHTMCAPWLDHLDPHTIPGPYLARTTSAMVTMAALHTGAPGKPLLPPAPHNMGTISGTAPVMSVKLDMGEHWKIVGWIWSVVGEQQVP
eukprot:m.181397 g.181397  ORF g.181397 m.181397 type:complete len:100 (-) comp18451_c1_seq5:2722-3021(-)